MKLYSELAAWWHLMSSPADYAEEARLFWDIISRYKQDITGALELGCGGGNNAFHLKKHCHFTLSDIAPEMLAESRTINPECHHHAGDMRALRLGKKFDLVFIHDAIMYMTTEVDLSKVFRTARAQVRDDGLLFIAPDFFRETFRPSTARGGHDHGERGLHYLEWTFDSDPVDSMVESEYAYLLRKTDGSVRCVHDRSTQGIFSKSTWARLLQGAGFEVTFETIAHSEMAEGMYMGIVGTPLTIG